MTSEEKNHSLFYKLITKEDDYTQLLYNLMVRFQDFRVGVLLLFLRDSHLVDQIEARHLSTQLVLKESGRPDLAIQSPEVFALVEVKLNEKRGLTSYQVPTTLDDTEVQGYFAYAASAKAKHKAVFFLVPDGWRPRDEAQKSLETLKERYSIATRTVDWSQIRHVAQQLRHSHAGIEEFYLLLKEKLGGVVFSEEEAAMLFQPGLPVRETMKICFLVDKIKEHCKGFHKIEGPKTSSDGEEYGFYTYGPDGGDLLWFGLWSPYWERRGRPLCFGVNKDTDPKVMQAFLRVYKGDTEEFEGYTLGWVPEEDLVASDDIGDSERKIWARLEPVVIAVREVGRN